MRTSFIQTRNNKNSRETVFCETLQVTTSNYNFPEYDTPDPASAMFTPKLNQNRWRPGLPHEPRGVHMDPAYEADGLQMGHTSVVVQASVSLVDAYTVL